MANIKVKNANGEWESTAIANVRDFTEVEPIVLSGQCQYACANQVASAYIEMFGNTISTDKIETSSEMFSRFKGSSIPFEVNMKSGTAQNMSSMFQYASSLEELPKINNAKPSNLSYMFYSCSWLRNIPEDWVDDWDWTSLHTSSGQCSYMFASCYSLRKIPANILKNVWSKSATSTHVPYYNGWYCCYALDELVGIPIQQASMTSNRCTGMVTSCNRLKNLIFEVNEDGSPKTATWKSQTIDLTGVGYGARNNITTKYNSGITVDKEVKDDTTYQALKNDPDWFTCDYNYCRYNHDSAVNTINSLPDCSATGTNTIKFKGEAGASTDGGAINTLTEEEIAVATEKGWTVTLV
jgi:hypothetical protein